MPNPGDKTRDRHGEIICRARWKNWLMCARPNCAPFVMTAYAWTLLHEENSVGMINQCASSIKTARRQLVAHLKKLSCK